MKKCHVKKGDQVVVITGNHRGRRGTILEIIHRRESVVIEANDEKSKQGQERERLIGAKLHHRKKSQQNPNGALIWLPGPIHVSNVMLTSQPQGKAAR